MDAFLRVYYTTALYMADAEQDDIRHQSIMLPNFALRRANAELISEGKVWQCLLS